MNIEKEEDKPTVLKSIKNYLQNIFDIRGDMMSYEEINAMMEENTIIHGSNMWILMMAILIASIGLNVNSTAVIIGAMLISPLMSGILTMGYALAIRDLHMLRKALGRFGTQVVISLIVSTIYFALSPLAAPTSEMVARTSPTIWDVLIALFGGIAGIIGNTRQKKGNVIPGVAIATALMPPLCTVGYGIANGEPQFIFGAFYLFLINTLFIALSATLVTVILKVPVHKEISLQKQKKINRMVGIITVVTVIPSIFVGGYTVYKTVQEQNIQSYLINEFVFENTQMVQSSTDIQGRIISVSLVGTPISEDTISRLEHELVKYDLKNYSLHITQNSVSSVLDSDNTDKITIAMQENAISELQAQLTEKGKMLEELENDVFSKIAWESISKKAENIFPNLTECSCGVMFDADGEYVLLSAMTEEQLEQGEIQIIENWLTSETGFERVELLLQSDGFSAES